jgi:integrative and conjugative element protein (TIGR02256 family)
MPTKLEGLSKELEGSGVTRKLLLALLQWTMLINPKDHPLFVVVGSPQRGIQSSGVVKQHLMAWQVSGLMLRALNVSTDSIRLQFDLDGLNSPEGVDLRHRIRANQVEAEQIAMESIQLVNVNWCNVFEDRPEVTSRRDERSPMGVFRGRWVCLWGCGALGSHVAYYLVKAGVKKLTVLDDGTVKPGLLVRQMFDEAEVGEAKVVALKRRLEKMQPGIEIDAINQTVLEDSTITDWAMGADFLIDCTASDTVHAKSERAWATNGQNRPPIISMIVGPRAERGIAVLVAPNATGAIKDAFRKAKLIACQRPELAAFAGDFYPKGHANKFFQPEPGCSDPTFEGSSADVAGLSALLLNAGANLVKKTSVPAAACFVCQPHLAGAKDGRTSYAEFSFEADIVCQNDYLVRLSPKAWKEMTAAIRESRRKRGAKCETGGLLFGKRDDALRVIWVDDAIGPPPDSVCSPEKFICGTKGTQAANKSRKEQSRGSVEFVGMWHTHPEDLPLPSETDLSGMAQILTSGEAPPLKSLLLIVGWERHGILLGTSVFSRRIFVGGKGVVTVAANHFPGLKA